MNVHHPVWESSCLSSIFLCPHFSCLLYFCARNFLTFCVYFIFVHKMSALFVSTLFLCTKCLHVLCLLYFLCTKCLHFLCLLCFWLIHRSNGFHSSAAFHSSVARKPKGRGKSCVAAHLRVSHKIFNGFSP